LALKAAAFKKAAQKFLLNWASGAETSTAQFKKEHFSSLPGLKIHIGRPPCLGLGWLQPKRIFMGEARW
jgi:hypothetical protein